MYNTRHISRIMGTNSSAPLACADDANVAAFACQVNVSACVKCIPNNN